VFSAFFVVYLQKLATLFICQLSFNELPETHNSGLIVGHLLTVHLFCCSQILRSEEEMRPQAGNGHMGFVQNKEHPLDG
jgi:hypothetical protein